MKRAQLTKHLQPKSQAGEHVAKMSDHHSSHQSSGKQTKFPSSTASGKTPENSEAARQKRLSTDEHRRRKKVENSKSHKLRMKNEVNWMMIQHEENNDRIHKLEKNVQSLSEELKPCKSRKASQGSKKTDQKTDEARPSWFGDPF